jgi:hypothetical protein
MSSLIDRIRGDLSNDKYYKQNFPNDGQRLLLLAHANPGP